MVEHEFDYEPKPMVKARKPVNKVALSFIWTGIAVVAIFFDPHWAGPFIGGVVTGLAYWSGVGSQRR